MNMESLQKNSLRGKLASGLDALFNPGSVAVIGASSTFAKWGQMILSNIVSGHFQGKVFPVNPREKVLCGLPVYRHIQDIPETVDLAFITTPAHAVPSILEGCAEKGVKGVVLITSGFSETDEAGKRLEKDIVSICREKGLTLIGPNTMGIICPYAGLFATGTHARPRKGSVAFISQSGNLGNQLIDWAEQQGIGISLFVGSGNEAVVTCTDYLEYLEHDPRTNIIMLYIESVGEGRRFFEAARRINRKKPVVILKGGRTQAGQVAAASHTGAMGGEVTVFRAACRQAGLLNVAVPSELLDLSAGFSSLPLPRGNRVGIVTLGGGWGVVTADACNEKGLVVPDIPPEIIETVGRYLPPFWSKGNPMDLVGTRDPDVPLVAVEELLKWEGIDAVVSLGVVGRFGLIRQMIQSTREVDPSASPVFLDQVEAFSHRYEEKYTTRIVEFMETYEKPVIGVSLAKTDEGTVRPVAGRRYSGVFYQTPESAVNVLARMVSYQAFIGS
ncbi:MAG: CoA-binding protein [Deltaproteobacteria bacterium]|nr:MAG: CoA-binding protein [Deltaproteobacteria bacterium]